MQVMAFLLFTDEAPAEAETRTFSPSVWAAVPAALQRSAMNAEIVGAE